MRIQVPDAARHGLQASFERHVEFVEFVIAAVLRERGIELPAGQKPMFDLMRLDGFDIPDPVQPKARPSTPILPA